MRHNNKLEAVVISTDEYERLKSLEEIFEAMEHQQIFETIQARKETPLSSYVPLEALAKKFNVKEQC